MHRLQLWAMANRYNSAKAPRDDNDSLIRTLKLSRSVSDDLINRVLGPDSGTAAFAAIARPASAAAPRASSSPSSPETRGPLISKPNPTDSFDPAIWGKGVLNIRNALVYADIMADNPRLAAHEIRRRMLEIINVQEQKAATKIQQAFRRLDHKLTDPDPELDPRQGLTVDLSLEGRKFEEAPGEYPTPPVPEISDEKYLSKRGIPSFRADERHSSKLKTKGRAKSTGEESGDSRPAAASSTRTGMDGIDPEHLRGQAPDYLASLARNTDEFKGEAPRKDFVSVFNTNIKPNIRNMAPKVAAGKIYELLGPWMLSRLNTPLIFKIQEQDVDGIYRTKGYTSLNPSRSPSGAPSLLELLARELEREVLVELVREVYLRLDYSLTQDQKLSVFNALATMEGFPLELIAPVLDVDRGNRIFLYTDNSEVFQDGNYYPERVKYYVKTEFFTPLDLITHSEREDFIFKKTDHTEREINSIKNYLAKPSVFTRTQGKDEFLRFISSSIPWSKTPSITLQGVIDSIRRGTIPETIRNAIRIIEFMGNADEYIEHIFENPGQFEGLAVYGEGAAYLPEDIKEKLGELMELIKQKAGY
jgi:hypothetical protein